MGKHKIILTADETMMSQYRGGMFAGFSTCMPRGILPDWFYFMAIAPPVPRKNGRAVYADFGLRMVEASLLEAKFDAEEVAIVHPRDLERMVGEETEIVAIGGHDLLGMNPPTSEFADLTRTGPPYNRAKFLEIIRKPCLRNVKVVVGGKSAWQLADPELMDKLGIDHIHLGEGELSVPQAFEAILRGERVPRIIEGDDPPVQKIPNLRGGVIHGLVGISRGCGRGCRFCTPGMQRLRHKSIDHILKDIGVNLEARNEGALLHSEDVLRYGTMRIEPNEDKVIELFERVTGLKGVKNLDTSHIALATVYHHPGLVRRVSELCMELPHQSRIGTQTGIETGSPRLLARHMHGKALPSPPERWPELVKQSLGILEDNHWLPACTLIYGLPGENADDVQKTLELQEELKGYRALIVPLFFVPMQGSALSAQGSFTVEHMTADHWRLLGACVEQNVKVARHLRREYTRGVSPLVRWMFDLAIRLLLRGAEGYIGKLKKGEPPRDYGKISKNYLMPEL